MRVNNVGRVAGLNTEGPRPTRKSEQFKLWMLGVTYGFAGGLIIGVLLGWIVRLLVGMKGWWPQ